MFKEHSSDDMLAQLHEKEAREKVWLLKMFLIPFLKISLCRN